MINDWAYSVLDPAGQYLEYRQLRRHPKLCPTWTTSYGTELGRLCQGLGTGPDGTGQRVKGTDTFRPIHYKDIAFDRRRGITTTKVVCKFRPGWLPSIPATLLPSKCSEQAASGSRKHLH